MKRMKLHDMSSDQLVERFAAIGIQQDEALLWNKIAKFNQLYEQKRVIEEELKSRAGDQRSALLPLYQHSNWQVRLNAVHATLALDPQAGRQMLETIANSRHFPQAGDAGMSLVNLDRGIYKPR